MTSKISILVTGATGKVGRQVVDQLLAADIDAHVRAMVREPERARLPSGTELVRGDLADPDTLVGCLDRVDAVFLVWPFLTAEAAPPVIDAIGEHARSIVYLSSLGVRDGTARQADPIHQFHADIERLIESSGLQWTFLRPSGFAGNTLGWAAQIRADGVVRGPYAAVARPLIHEADIAAVAVRALVGDAHHGTKPPITGPASITQAEQAHTIGEAIGRPVTYEEIPPETALRHMTEQGWPAGAARGLLAAHAAFLSEPEPVSHAVEEITGVPARSFREWAADHADDFR
ncbi:NAD(P)H-binding protein [Streptomyces sp. RB6PN25]|uniref:NAD(P)H-binding protein n=1 Tax=Streptomyces humicola TaxID=2953240 RepID=A0ABT1Q425_9ACTN|nr:NAD(P)H-binding protein [Streptomyces humicola]MCQ4084624.1 NAD(P)H-binding protein [Streptomyces humicola]